MSWQKQVLRVDLTRGEISTEPLNMEWARAYLGSRGLGCRYLMAEMDAAVDPLAAENVLIFATGPLSGTMASTSGRYSVITKGPLTGAIACSNSGGKFGAELKFCGYDLLIIRGRAPKPVYLNIRDQQVELLGAEAIWGQSVWATDTWLHKQQQDPQLKIAAIGRAGEKLVRYACVVNDLHRAAGRSGVGAVMGSKNLKAICARGTTGVGTDNPKPPDFMAAIGETNAKLHASGSRRGLMRYGTLSMLDSMQEFGGLPTHNFQAVKFAGAARVNHRAVVQQNRNGHTNLIRNAACFGCTIGCGRIAKIDPQHFSVKHRPQYWVASGGLEYETAFALGPAIGVDDLDALTFAGFMMNEHGLDPISFGVTLAAAMELYKLGLITDADTDGLALNFGNAEALVVMAEKTGLYEGFGQQLGLGSRRLCEKYGRPELAMVAKGQEFAGYDGRAMQGMGLGYATSNRGACHLRHDTFTEDSADPSTRGKAEACATSQNFISMVDASGLCLFTTGAWDYADFAKMLSADLGETWDEARLARVGERIWNLEKLFNVRAGLGKKDDSLPPRILNDPAPDGFNKGGVCELDTMLTEYYRLRGWSADGIPEPAKLRELEITV